MQRRTRHFGSKRRAIASASACVLTALLARGAVAADPPKDVPLTPQQWKLDQLLFCIQSAAGAKLLFLEELKKNCLSGAKRVPSDATLCSHLKKAPDGKPTPSGLCVDPEPALACTTCAPTDDEAECGVASAVTGSVGFAKTKDGEILIKSDDGTSFAIEGSYSGPMTIAHVALQVKEDGHDGPFDLVTALMTMSYHYSESTLMSGAVTINGTRYYPPQGFSCGHREKGEKWALAMRIDRDCSSPVNQVKPEPPEAPTPKMEPPVKPMSSSLDPSK